MTHYLIDTSNVLYRGYYSYPEHPCGEVFFLLTTIRTYLNDPYSHVYLCIDGKPKGKQINEAYKSNRNHGEVSVYRYLPQVVYLLQNLNRVHVKYNPNLEADEVIYSLTRILPDRKIIVSSDNDLLQALREDTEIIRKKKIINKQCYQTEMFQKFHAVDPKRLPVYRAIVGDTSDNLKPPVPRFPKELAARIASDIEYNGNVPVKEQLKELFSLAFYKSSTEAKKNKLNDLLGNYTKFASNFEIIKLNVYRDLDYPYVEKDLTLSNFPSDVISLLGLLKLLDKKQ